jgi:hypothetical protein
MMTESTNEQPKILLFVEDEPDIVTLYKSTFEKNGFSVDATDSGTTALERINAYREANNKFPDIMVFDILLPDKISGMDILREVRKHSELDAIPIIMFTNFSSDEFRKEIEGMPNTRYMLKLDATPNQLVEEIKGMIES